jgi:GTPase involved in cell partitioning and DNA repair
MKFYDKVQIICISGNGGDGATSARRESGVPYGGPNGGNGGHGGSVVFQADSNYNTLLHLRMKKEWASQDGGPGESTDKYGKSAEDLIIPVPVWSIIKIVTTTESDVVEEDENKYNFKEEYDDFEDDFIEPTEKHVETTIVYHFVEHGEQFTICRWWLGGAWNMHFKNSQVQYPDFSLMGEPGQKKHIEIELQLLADVGLIGMPSVGKSSIINSVSNTKAKVAEYHFTTLIPNLWSVKHNGESWNIIDIPGLVEWASEWKWLGNEFLRHVLKARLFAFVLDITRWDEGIFEFGKLWNEILTYIHSRFIGSQEFGFMINDIRFDLEIIDNQTILQIYDQDDRLLLQKSIAWIVNKIDEAMDEEILTQYKSQLIDHALEAFNKTWLLKDKKKSQHKQALSHQVFEYSTILEQFKKPLLQFMFEKIQGIQPFSVHFDPVEAAKLERKRWIEKIWTLEDEEVVDTLSELWFYVQDFAAQASDYGVIEDEEDEEEDDNESEYENDTEEADLPVPVEKDVIWPKKVFKLYEREVTRLWYQLPWWKVLAEEWFWRVMKQQGLHKWLNKVWVKNGDILRVVGDYNSNKHVIFMYMLWSTKTSYKHQKLT